MTGGRSPELHATSAEPERGLPRVMFFGTYGDLSLRPLAALLDDGFPLCAVVVPRPRDPSSANDGAQIRRLEPTALLQTLPLLDAPAAANIVHLAWEQGIPVLEVERLRDPACRAALEPFRPDVLCVSCFPQILPASLVEWPRLGGLNVHPSLLPAYRGPAPLFWHFRNGEEHAGVTIHIMDPGVDSGDILLQETFPIPEGITGPALTRDCARRGARLLVEALRGVAGRTLAASKQPAGGSCYSWPKAVDLEAPTTRSARWAFNFIRGVSAWGAVTIFAEGHRLVVREALGYTETGTLGRAYERSDTARARIQFAPGILEVTLAADPGLRRR
jgi:methionyl-tRNA formyltransferase